MFCGDKDMTTDKIEMLSIYLTSLSDRQACTKSDDEAESI